MHHQNKNWRAVSWHAVRKSGLIAILTLAWSFGAAAQNVYDLDGITDTPVDVTPYQDPTYAPRAPSPETSPTSPTTAPTLETAPVTPAPGPIYQTPATAPVTPAPGPIYPTAPTAPTPVAPMPVTPAPITPAPVAPSPVPGPVYQQPQPISPQTATPPASYPQPSAETGLQPAPQNTTPVSIVPLPNAQPSGAPSIAVLLPVKTPGYAGAAQNLLHGFTAAARAANATSTCLVIEHEVGNVVAAYNQAVQAGAQVVVGPLVRDDLRDLVNAQPPLWTIALTQLEDTNLQLPEKVLPLTLAIESDAKLLAREIAVGNSQGLPLILSSESPLMRRFSDAFIEEWLALGKTQPPSRILFDPKSLAGISASLADVAPSVVLLAVDGDNASLARAQTRAWVTYASGLIYRRALKFEGYLLDQVRVVEVPWLIVPTATQFAALGAQPALPASVRLYALGFDAFQVASSFVSSRPATLDFWGASGNIHYDPEHGLTRFGQLGVFESGQLRPLGKGPGK